TVKICNAYELDGETIDYVPSTLNKLQRCKPVYIEMPGWKEEVTAVRNFDDLPANAKNYLKKIEELTKTEIVIVSVGPDRTQTIQLKTIF
nr:adenylosuccinate synthetase [Paludibacteraceae bacterium]